MVENLPPKAEDLQSSKAEEDLPSSKATVEQVVRLLVEEKYGLHITLAYLGFASPERLKMVQQDLTDWFGKDKTPWLISITDQYEMMGENRDIRTIKCCIIEPRQKEVIQRFYQKHNVPQQWMIDQGLPARPEPNYHITVKPGTEQIIESWKNQLVHGLAVDIKPLGLPAPFKAALVAT